MRNTPPNISNRKEWRYASLSLALMHSEGSSERGSRGLFSGAGRAAIQGDSAYELRLLSGRFMYYLKEETTMPNCSERS